MPSAEFTKTTQIDLGREGWGRALQQAVSQDPRSGDDLGSRNLAVHLDRNRQHLGPIRRIAHRADAVGRHVCAVEAARSGNGWRGFSTQAGMLPATALPLSLAARHTCRRGVE